VYKNKAPLYLYFS